MVDILPLVVVLVTGGVAGVLVNYLSDVLPRRRRLTAPFCLACEQRAGWSSYLLVWQRCTACGKAPGLRRLVVGIVFLGVSTWLWVAPPEGWNYFTAMTLLVFFGVVTVIDIEHRLILHLVSFVGFLAGIILGTWRHGFLPTLAGGAFGFLVMLAMYYLGFAFIRLRSRKSGEAPVEDALGFGDVNLSGIIGLLLGWPGVIAGVVLAIVLAGAVSLFYLLTAVVLRRYRANMAIPYGPFLVASAVWLLFLRESLSRVGG